jgi:hypothetical protein
VISTRPIQADENIIKRVTAVEGQTVNVYKPGSLAPVQIQVRWQHGSTAVHRVVTCHHLYVTSSAAAPMPTTLAATAAQCCGVCCSALCDVTVPCALWYAVQCAVLCAVLSCAAAH